MINEIRNHSPAKPGDLVAVAMSGGVDSSVAAAVLHEKGCRVIGLTMRVACYSEKQDDPKDCCNLSGVADARAVCQSIGAPHYVIDCEADFQREVIQPFIDEYLAGRTPNPCVLCNRRVKFDLLFQRAKQLGAKYLATGHYVRLLEPDGRTFAEGKPVPRIAMGVDDNKDQTYFLWALRREQLPFYLFPIGKMNKSEVREKAAKLGLINSKKAESQEVCFIDRGGLGKFLKKNASAETKTLNPGPIVDTEGQRIGTHQGAALYTVGQRKGLGISVGRPAYVSRIDADTNTVVISDDDELWSDTVVAGLTNFLVEKKAGEKFRAKVKIRYRQQPVDADVEVREGDRLLVKLDNPARAITAGQSVVIYEDDILVGGAVIDKPESE